MSNLEVPKLLFVYVPDGEQEGLYEFYNSIDSTFNHAGIENTIVALNNKGQIREELKKKPILVADLNHLSDFYWGLFDDCAKLNIPIHGHRSDNWSRPNAENDMKIGDIIRYPSYRSGSDDFFDRFQESTPGHQLGILKFEGLFGRDEVSRHCNVAKNTAGKFLLDETSIHNHILNKGRAFTKEGFVSFLQKNKMWNYLGQEYLSPNSINKTPGLELSLTTTLKLYEIGAIKGYKLPSSNEIRMPIREIQKFNRVRDKYLDFDGNIKQIS